MDIVARDISDIGYKRYRFISYNRKEQLNRPLCGCDVDCGCHVDCGCDVDCEKMCPSLVEQLLVMFQSSMIKTLRPDSDGFKKNLAILLIGLNKENVISFLERLLEDSTIDNNIKEKLKEFSNKIRRHRCDNCGCIGCNGC